MLRKVGCNKGTDDSDALLEIVEIELVARIRREMSCRFRRTIIKVCQDRLGSCIERVYIHKLTFDINYLHFIGTAAFLVVFMSLHKFQSSFADYS